MEYIPQLQNSKTRGTFSPGSLPQSIFVLHEVSSPLFASYSLEGPKAYIYRRKDGILSEGIWNIANSGHLS